MFVFAARTGEEDRRVRQLWREQLASMLDMWLTNQILNESHIERFLGLRLSQDKAHYGEPYILSIVEEGSLAFSKATSFVRRQDRMQQQSLS